VPPNLASLAAQHLALIFLASGVAFGVISIIGAALLAESPVGDSADRLPWTPTSDIARNPDIWVMWMILLINVGAGLFVLTNLVNILREITNAPIEQIVGIISFLGLTNGLGRIVFGWMSDAVDRRRVVGIIFTLEFLAFTVLTTPIAHSLWISVVMVAIIMLCYGGLFGVMPALVASTVGIRNFSRAYGLVLSGWGLASLGGSAGAVLARSMPTGVMLSPIDLVLCLSLMFPILLGLRASERFSVSN
jgi:OFA family oxalate/formate antiporter-like MFS transporter